MINLATPEQLAHAARAMDSVYLDELVNDAAAWIRDELGDGRKVYHVATTQFALLAAPGVTLDVCVRVIEAKIAGAIATIKSSFVATPAVGVAPFEVGTADCLSVLRRAQSAVQDAIEGSSHVAVYSAHEDRLYRRRFTLLGDFALALASSDQLRLVYQPRIDIASGLCVGAEALLRWNHPTLGAIGPAEFIPFIERSRLAQATTAWVLEKALEQQLAWRAAGMEIGRAHV